MTSMVAQVPSRGWQGAVLKLLRADDFLLTVAGVESITDHYVRVHFADGGLLARTALHPTMWIRLWFERDGRLHQRGYTVVDPDPATGTFFVEFAIHDGAAARWAQTTFVGDEIPATVMGSNYALPEPSPDGWLIVGDAAALPAVNSLLDAIEASESPDVPITIWMEYQHEDEFTLPLRVREHHRVEWLSRTGHLTVDFVLCDAGGCGACGRVQRHRLSRVGRGGGGVDPEGRRPVPPGVRSSPRRGDVARLLGRRSAEVIAT